MSFSQSNLRLYIKPKVPISLLWSTLVWEAAGPAAAEQFTAVMWSVCWKLLWHWLVTSRHWLQNINSELVVPASDSTTPTVVWACSAFLACLFNIHDKRHSVACSDRYILFTKKNWGIYISSTLSLYTLYTLLTVLITKWHLCNTRSETMTRMLTHECRNTTYMDGRTQANPLLKHCVMVWNIGTYKDTSIG